MKSLSTACIVLAISFYSIAAQVDSADSLGVSNYSMRNLCGVTSAYTILRSAGLETSYDEILKGLPPGLYGNSMSQLSQFLTERGMNVLNAAITGEELLRFLKINGEARAVALFVDHWVVVQGEKGRYLCIIDHPRKYYVSASGFDSLSDGTVLVAAPVPLRMRLSFSKVVLVAMGVSCVVAGVAVLVLVKYLSLRKGSSSFRQSAGS